MDSHSKYHAVLNRVLTHALNHLDSLNESSVSATSTKEELRMRLNRPLSDCGTAADQVIDDLVSDSAGGWLGNAGGRFFGWVIGGAVPAALAADWLTSTWDQNAALYACGPAAAIIEEICGAWLKELLGIPKGASFALVTGCQMSHVTCLAAARHRLLDRSGWDVEGKGLAGSRQIRLLTGPHRHGSIERAVRLLGMGRDCIVDVPVDDCNRLVRQELEHELQRQEDTPAIVVLQAGDINTGSFDSFAELIPLAHEYGAWVHIDGAFGLWANASPKCRHFLKGIEAADSWSSDGHKWLNVPYDCGYAFVKDRAAHQASMSLRASYLTHDDDARDQIDWNPEWSRRGRGIATYAAIRELGRQGIAAVVDGACSSAQALATRIGALPGVQLIWRPQLNQGLVRFLDPSANATEHEHGRRTDEIIERILRTGEAFFGGTTWRGMRCMRISVCNWQTSDQDVERAVNAVRQVLFPD
jgi:glutamate/tyrosine decarboxylase-like PLP-dependent enzyme